MLLRSVFILQLTVHTCIYITSIKRRRHRSIATPVTYNNSNYCKRYSTFNEFYIGPLDFMYLSFYIHSSNGGFQVLLWLKVEHLHSVISKSSVHTNI